jgi:hypothetical protein
MKQSSKWNEVFAWYPITTLTGKRAWWKKVYKRRSIEIVIEMQGVVSITYYEYATALDILQLP